MQLAHGGGGCSHDTTLAALTQGAWRRSEPSGEAVRRRPATGSRTPTPNEHARRGSPAGRSHSACSRAIGHSKLPTTGRIQHKGRGWVAFTGLSHEMVRGKAGGCPGERLTPSSGSSG